MALSFRNLDASPAEPVESWPAEGVRAALERGQLPEWRRLREVIDAEPWGRTAQLVEETLAHARPYGVAELFELIIERARERAAESERQAVAGELRELVAASGLTQAELASRIGTSASRFSTYVNGSVTPAATLMVRARSAAANSRTSTARPPSR